MLTKPLFINLSSVAVHCFKTKTTICLTKRVYLESTSMLLKTHHCHPHAARVTRALGLYAPLGQPPVRVIPPHLCCAESTEMRSTGRRVSRLS